MVKSPKSSIIKAHAISWGGAILCALILTYGPHGPAKHPKLMLPLLVMLAVLSLRGLWVLGGSGLVKGLHIVLWLAAAVTAFSVANTSIGDGLHPLTTTVAFGVLAAISLGVLSNAKFTAPTTEETSSDS